MPRVSSPSFAAFWTTSARMRTCSRLTMSRIHCRSAGLTCRALPVRQSFLRRNSFSFSASVIVMGPLCAVTSGLNICVLLCLLLCVYYNDSGSFCQLFCQLILSIFQLFCQLSIQESPGMFKCLSL